MESNEDFLSKNIIRLRNSLKLTQSELAERADVSLRGLQDIEYNKIKSPRSTTLLKIARALGVDVIDLYGEQKRPTSKSDLITQIITALPTLDELELNVLLSRIKTFPSRNAKTKIS